jgi:hypothetical protein
MKPDSSQWRRSPAYDFTRNATADILAWEFLRRNPTYQREFADIRSASSARASQMLRRLRERWGLRFPRQS